jgi:YARHG domain-containing protein
MRTIFVIALVFGVACKGKEPAKSAEPAAKPAPGQASGSSAAPAPTAPPAAADERCADPCRFLATTALADIAGEVKKTCGLEWKPAAADDCDQPDYLRNCIYANAGYTFKRKQWQQTFGAATWYKPRADFKDADLGKVALANVAALKQQAKDCRTSQAVKPADIAIVEKWLDGVRAGKPEMPAVTMLGSDKVDANVLAKQLADSKDDFKKGLKTEYRYTENDWGGAFKGQTVRTIEFSPGNAEPHPDCQDEEGCDSGDIIEIALDDKGKVVAVSQLFVACPHVYVAGRFQGEILRDLARPALERWQALPIELRCDGGVVNVRIVEDKPEVSELDTLELVVDGQHLRPLACGALCGNDGVAQTLRQGETLDVAFALPPGARCGRALLRANGHYVSAAATTR